MKHFRQAAILDLVAREAIDSQDRLRQRLHARGFDATQATISRDLKELKPDRTPPGQGARRSRAAPSGSTCVTSSVWNS